MTIDVHLNSVHRSIERHDPLGQIHHRYAEMRDNMTVTRDAADAYGPKVLGPRMLKGMKSVRMIRKLLSSVYRTPEQIQFHEDAIKCMKEVIFQGEYDDNAPLINEFLGISPDDDIPPNLAVSWQRRRGKTYGTVLFCLAVFLSVEGFQCIVFSPGQRQSDMFGSLFRKLYPSFRDIAFPEGGVVELMNNKHGMHILGPDGEPRKLDCLPAVQAVSSVQREGSGASSRSREGDLGSVVSSSSSVGDGSLSSSIGFNPRRRFAFASWSFASMYTATTTPPTTAATMPKTMVGDRRLPS